jgi:hydrogenase/urease accessory protein HupE
VRRHLFSLEGFILNRVLRSAKIRFLIPGLIVLILSEGKAYAHLVTTGLGPIYDGISHLFLSPDDLLGVLALAMLAGLGGPIYGRRVLFLLPPFWLIGGVAGLMTLQSEVSLPVISTFSFLIIGLFVVLDRRYPEWLIVLLAALLGLLHGFLNGTAMAETGDGFLALLGIGSAVFVVVALSSALIVSLKPSWTRVAVRVAGSWIVAIGMLMLGWSFRSGG